MTKKGLAAKDVADRMSPVVTATTVTRWRSGKRVPEQHGHRAQLRAMFNIPDPWWGDDEREGTRAKFLEEHPATAPDPRQFDLPAGSSS